MTTTCDLCGATDQPIRHGLVAWREPVFGHNFDDVDRCLDLAACKARVAAKGEPWPVVDTSREKAS